MTRAMSVQTRGDQVVLISEPVDRDKWLAGEIDTVEVHTTDKIATLEKRLNQILAVALTILITLLSTLATLVLSGGSGA